MHGGKGSHSWNNCLEAQSSVLLKMQSNSLSISKVPVYTTQAMGKSLSLGCPLSFHISSQGKRSAAA